MEYAYRGVTVHFDLRKIDNMKEQDYLDLRLEDQINWYDKKSKFNQKMYKRLVLIEIILSVSIPFFASYINDENPVVKVTIGIIGVSIALIAGVMNLYKFHENWISYRTTSETLKHEKYLYLTKSGIYKENESQNTPYSSLVQRVESIISKENTNWQQKTNKKEK